jgi:DNA-binding transcriptional LysR family regulator
MKLENLNLAYLKYFIDAVESKSLTRSAEMNHVSRPAVSKAIQRLEDWAGFSLVTHEKKLFQLTKNGENFYRYAKSAFQQMENVFAKEVQDSGSLKVGCSASLADDFLIPVLKSLEGLGTAKIKVGPSMRIRHLLHEDEIRLGLVIDNVDDSRLEREVIYRGQFLFASKGGEFSDLLITTEDRPEVAAARRYLASKNRKIKRHIEVESWALALKLAQTLSGTCLVPDFMIQNTLKKIATSGFKHGCEIALIHKGRQFMSALDTKCMELSRALAKQM